jgi:hypothetical protein
MSSCKGGARTVTVLGPMQHRVVLAHAGSTEGGRVWVEALAAPGLVRAKALHAVGRAARVVLHAGRQQPAVTVIRAA